MRKQLVATAALAALMLGPRQFEYNGNMRSWSTKPNDSPARRTKRRRQMARASRRAQLKKGNYRK